jgi:hypothetical protein
MFDLCRSSLQYGIAGWTVTPSPRLKLGAYRFSFLLGFIPHSPARFAGSMAYATRLQRLEIALRLRSHTLVRDVTAPIDLINLWAKTTPSIPELKFWVFRASIFIKNLSRKFPSILSSIILIVLGLLKFSAAYLLP